MKIKTRKNLKKKKPQDGNIIRPRLTLRVLGELSNMKGTSNVLEYICIFLC